MGIKTALLQITQLVNKKNWTDWHFVQELIWSFCLANVYSKNLSILVQPQDGGCVQAKQYYNHQLWNKASFQNLWLQNSFIWDHYWNFYRHDAHLKVCIWNSNSCKLQMLWLIKTSCTLSSQVCVFEYVCLNLLNTTNQSWQRNLLWWCNQFKLKSTSYLTTELD